MRKGNVTPGELIGALVAIVIGVSLYPTVQSVVDGVNATGTTESLLNLVPILFVIGVVVGSIAFLGLDTMTSGGRRAR